MSRVAATDCPQAENLADVWSKFIFHFLADTHQHPIISIYLNKYSTKCDGKQVNLRNSERMVSIIVCL